MTCVHRIAAIQVNPTDDRGYNMRRCVHALVQAAQQGVRLAVLPELCMYRGNPAHYHSQAEEVGGPLTTCMAAIARDLDIAIVFGMIERECKGKRLYDTAVYIAADGTVKGTYRKQRLFSVTLGKKRIDESRFFSKGTGMQVWQYAGESVGCAICFDIRFPELFQRQQCSLWCIPSNFTAHTGKAHWHSLVRARAIETQSYVVAANCCGRDVYTGIESFGHSMIIDPWGTVCAEAQGKEAVITSDIDFAYVNHVRTILPLSR